MVHTKQGILLENQQLPGWEMFWAHQFFEPPGWEGMWVATSGVERIRKMTVDYNEWYICQVDGSDDSGCKMISSE